MQNVLRENKKDEYDIPLIKRVKVSVKRRRGY